MAQSADDLAGPKERQKRAWWKESTVYQIYPSSFKDSNGDGIGDIPGVIEKLDYIKTLGVDLVWLSPVCQSPQVDMGYDISDYKEIHQPYGTVEDMVNLIQGLHARGMKYVMDLVVNHTSDQHEWFKKSRASKDNEYRDWYIWKKPKYDSAGQRQPPNNWSSYFGGSAWQWDEATQEYYLHLFAVEQPDLNWEHPSVREAVHDIIRFWLEKGVDGFRMDVINFISKVPGLPDAPVTQPAAKYQHAAVHYACGPRLHEYLQEIGKILKEYDAFSVGEMPAVTDSKELLKAVGYDRGELNMIFHFEIMDIDHGPGGKFIQGSWKLTHLKCIVDKWQRFMYENNGWNALYIENHDQPRSITRFACGSPRYRSRSAKLLATFLGLQSGTLFVYQGQELGQVNVPQDWKMDDFRDLETLNHWNELLSLHPDDLDLQKRTKLEYVAKSRDNARTPMQWDASSPNAGFSTGTPWIPVHPDFETWNALSSVSNPNGIYHYWRQILSLRKSHSDIFVYGSFEMLDPGNEAVFAYLRQYGTDAALVVANFMPSAVEWRLPTVFAGWSITSSECLMASYTGETEGSAEPARVEEFGWRLRPYEAFSVLLSKRSRP